MNKIIFNDPIQVADPCHPQHKKWIVQSKETHTLLGNDGIYYAQDSSVFVFLTKELVPVFYDMLDTDKKHRMYFDSEADALLAIADYGLLNLKVDPQSGKTVVKSEELFDD